MQYASIRVTRQALERLQSYRDRLQVQVNQNPVRFAKRFEDGRVSLDGALQYLLDQKDNHAARSTANRVGGARPKDQFMDDEMVKQVSDSMRRAALDDSVS